MEFGVGSILEGKVTGITKFGAFVSLPEGRSGLVHISEIAYSYVNEVSDHLQEGQEVKVKVIGIDENNRINLSIKKVTEPPARPAGQGQGGRPRQQGGYAPRQGGAPRQQGGYAPRQQGGYAPRQGGAPRQQGGYAPRQGGTPRQQSGFTPRPAASKEPLDFEDRLKQFMQSSDSKLSELRYIEKKGGNRRGGGRR